MIGKKNSLWILGISKGELHITPFIKRKRRLKKNGNKKRTS